MSNKKKEKRVYKTVIGSWICDGFYDYEMALKLLLSITSWDKVNSENAFICEI